MLFHSHIFIFLFLPLTLAGWYLLNRYQHKKLAQGYLIGMSLWFYGYFDFSCLWIFLAECLIGYFFCIQVCRAKSDLLKKILFFSGCLFHLGALGYFKYTNFFLENVNALFGADYPFLSIVLPVGISFYTFQQLAYLSDCFRGEYEACSFWEYLLFLAYFPQILQGPILLGKELIPQFSQERNTRFEIERFTKGVFHFVIGLSKKVLLADTLARAVDFGYENIPLLDSPSALFLAVGYMLELYFDFSGYCDMAVGIGKMIGIEIPENFDAPFRSVSVRDFWRRWHITLGRFFTKYVYIPLGGSRKGKVRTIRNTLIVFLLSGLWHGASWNFVFWGFLHGIGVLASGLTDSFNRRVRQVLTFFYVCFAFVFFRAASIGEGFSVLKAVFSFRWNGFLFQIAESLDISEVYVFTKALSMKAPVLLQWAQLCMLILLLAVCAVVLLKKKTAVMAEEMGVHVKRGQAVLLAVLFVWSILSMTGVSTFLYFTF